MTLLLLLLACGSKPSTLTAGTSGGEPTVFTIDEAELTLESPAPSSFVDVGRVVVTGRARAMDAVTVNGVDADIDASEYAAELPLVLGINTLDVSGVDVDGGDWRAVGTVLAGEFAPADGPVLDAIQVHLGPDAIDDLVPVLGGLITPDLLNPMLLAANPIVDSSSAYVELGALSFDPPTAQLVPTAQGLQMALTLPNFVLPIHATIPDALPFGVDLDLDPDLEADAVVLFATVDLDVDGNGNLEVDLKNVRAELQGFDLDTGILELIDWLVIDDDDIAAMIENQVAALGPGLGAAMTGLVRGLDLRVETELLGLPLTVWPAFASASTDASGLALGLAVAVDVDAPAPDAPGHLHFPPPTPADGRDLTVQLADDFVNRALFELWAAGALDIELPLNDPASLIILGVFGGVGSGTLRLEAGLPPVWLERDGATRLQLGGAKLTVDTPNGKYGEQVEMLLDLDAAAEVTLTAEAAGVVLSDPVVGMVLTGASADVPELAENLDAIEGAFGLGLGIINDLLAFPLDGFLGPDVTLPALDLRRDPSGVGLVTDLKLSEIDILAILLATTSGGATAGTTTTP